MTTDRFSLNSHVFTEMLKFVGRLQDVEIVEDGPKHTLVLYNCKVPLTGEVLFTAANAKCSANLKVKGELSLPSLYLPVRSLNKHCTGLSSLKVGSDLIVLQFYCKLSSRK